MIVKNRSNKSERTSDLNFIVENLMASSIKIHAGPVAYHAIGKHYYSLQSWISILYTDWFYAFGRLSKKGQNLFSILVSILQLTELNTFIITFY